MHLSNATKILLAFLALAISIFGFMLKLPSAFRYIDKELHAAFYFLAAAFLNLLFAKRNMFIHAAIFISLYVFGMAIEFAQAYSNRFFHKRIHGRYDVEDIKANLTGLILFSVCWIILQSIFLLYKKVVAQKADA